MGNTRTQYLVDERGKKKGVVLPLARYRRLLEDVHDLAVVAERRREQTIPLDEMKRRLKTHGAL